MYGEADPVLTYKVTSGSLAYDDKLSGALDRANGQGVGTYAIGRGDLTPGSNYDLTYRGADFTVTARPLTVTADPQSKVYGDADPELTYKLSDGALRDGDAITGSLAREDGEKVGSYAIRRGSLTAGPNYDLTFVGAQLRIAARAITVTADPQSKVYGNADPALGYEVTAGHLASGDTLSGALTRESGEDVGAYAIRQGTLTAGTDYVLTFESANLRVTKAELTITADDQSKVYGAGNPDLSGKIVGLRNGDEITASYSTVATAGSKVGDYAIVPAAVDSATQDLANYTVTLVNGTLRVTKAELTITADDQSKVYGAGTRTCPGRSWGCATVTRSPRATPRWRRRAARSGSTRSCRRRWTPRPRTWTTTRVTLVNGTLRVTKAELTVTADGPVPKVYGAGNPDADREDRGAAERRRDHCELLHRAPTRGQQGRGATTIVAGGRRLRGRGPGQLRGQAGRREAGRGQGDADGDRRRQDQGLRGREPGADRDRDRGAER